MEIDKCDFIYIFLIKNFYPKKGFEFRIQINSCVVIYEAKSV